MADPSSMPADFASARDAGFLPLFWELAAVEDARRLAAAKSLEARTFTAQAELGPVDAGADARLEDVVSAEVLYTIKRLVRGLPSSRDAAREGFALALTVVVSAVPAVTLSHLLELSSTALALTKQHKGQEERDLLFGRLFFNLAVIRSGVLARDSTKADDAVTCLTQLLQVSDRKSYVRDVGIEAACQLLAAAAVGRDSHSDIVVALRDAALAWARTRTDAGALAIQFEVAASLRAKWSRVLPDWVEHDPLNESNLTRLADVLRETTTSNPRLHPVWSRLIAIVAERCNDQGKGHAVVQAFWTAVGDSLMTSTLDRRFIAFSVLKELLVALPASAAPLLTSATTFGTLIRVLRDQDSILYKVAESAVRLFLFLFVIF